MSDYRVDVALYVQADSEEEARTEAESMLTPQAQGNYDLVGVEKTR